MTVSKTKIHVHRNLGPDRWHMQVWFPRGGPHHEFEAWVRDTFHDVFCKFYSNYGGDPYYELRGGNPDDQTLIALRWAE